MSDDDDVSIIALSDDDSPRPRPTSQTVTKNAPVSSGSTQRVSFAPDATGESSRRGRGGSGGQRSGIKQSHGKGRGTVEPVVYEDDEEEQDLEQKYYGDDDDDEGGYYQGAGDTVLDEEGLGYISDRFASHQGHGSGPSTWLEVNEAEIREVSG